MSNSLSRNSSRSFASFRNRCIYLFLLALCIGNFLVHAQSDSSAAAGCKDKKKKIRVGGKVKQFCTWVAEQPETRCKTKKKKKKTKKNKTGQTKTKTIIYNPKKLCGCTCADYLKEEAKDDEMLCPPLNEARSLFDHSNTSRSSVKNSQPIEKSCIRDGYQQGRKCEYDWAWRNCRYDKLQCLPDVVCKCADEEITGERDVWSCKIYTFDTCEERPRPDPETGSSPPYYVPEEAGKTCQEGDSVPKPPEGFNIEPDAEAGDEVLQIRHHLRQ